MSELLPDTWASRDLPFLLECVRRIASEEYGSVDPSRLALEMGMSEADGQLAVRALLEADPPYLSTALPGDGRIMSVRGITERARRTVGVWPTGDTAVQRLVAALEEAAGDETEDQDTRGAAAKAASALKGAAGKIAIGVMTAVITGQVT